MAITLADVWFSSDLHMANFMKLAAKYNASNNPKCAAACYVFGHPEIYSKVDWEKSLSSPIEWFFGDGPVVVDEQGEFRGKSESVGSLSGPFASLAKAAVELFEGRQYDFRLPGFLEAAEDEIFMLFVQMLEIRRDRKLISFLE